MSTNDSTTESPWTGTDQRAERVARYAKVIDLHAEAESEAGYNRWRCTCGEVIATGRKAGALLALRTHQAVAVMAITDDEVERFRDGDGTTEPQYGADVTVGVVCPTCDGEGMVDASAVDAIKRAAKVEILNEAADAFYEQPWVRASLLGRAAQVARGDK